MLANFQSVAVMQEQIDSGYNYYLMIYHGRTCWLPFHSQRCRCGIFEQDLCAKRLQGKRNRQNSHGFCDFRNNTAGLGLIRLTVNKKNTGSILVYEKMGFQNMASVVTEIGEGYVMDDFVMEKKIL